MEFKLLGFLLLISFIGAKLEINIEGRDGWAKNLPTWRVKDSLTRLIWGELPLTGYHFWLILFVLSFFHLPFLLGTAFSLKSELLILGGFFLFWMIEDFLWFLLNPKYGFKKFNRNYANFVHKNWFLKLPVAYWKFLFTSLILLILSRIF